MDELVELGTRGIHYRGKEIIPFQGAINAIKTVRRVVELSPVTI